MAASELRIIATLLVSIVQISIHEELDAFFQCKLVRTYRPEHLRLLARVEAIDIHKGVITSTKAGAKSVLIREGAFRKFDIA